MSSEAFNRPEAHQDHAEKARAVEVAAGTVERLRALIAEIEQRLGLERTAASIDAAMVVYLEKHLEELTKQLEEAFAFLEEFDPLLHQTLRNNS